MNYVNLMLWGIFVLLLTLTIGASVHWTEGFLVEAFGSSCIDFIPFKMPSNEEIIPGTIFVSIASYRDYECSVTLQTLFSQADHPERIFVGICEQNKEGEYDEICKNDNDPVVSRYSDNIRVLKLDHTQAKGPTYARYYCADLWKGEEYFLQIDSHTTFQPHWDTDLIGMIQQIKNDPNESDYPVLSAYPPTEKQVKMKGFPEMDNGKIASNGLPIFICGWHGESNEIIRSNKPWAAAGFMFLESKFLKEVPFDPNLSHLFQGEETLFSARLFTNGYDFYTPNKNVAYHHYSREGPMYHQDVKESNKCRGKAEQRVKFLLGIGEKKSVADEFLKDLHYYGLGKLRTMDDFWKASGADPSKTSEEAIEKWNDKNPPSAVYDGWWFRRDGYQNIKKRS